MKKVKPGCQLVKWYYGKEKEIPNDWSVISLGELTTRIENGLQYDHDMNKKTGIPITRIETISFEKIDDSKVGYVENVSKSDLEKYSLKNGDILFSHINSLKHVGRTAFYDGTPKLILHGMNLLRISAKNKKITPDFLNQLLKFQPTRERFRAICNSAINQVSINTTQLKKQKFIIPTISEQEKISFILKSIDDLILVYDDIIKTTKKLEKGLMQQLLTKGIGHKKFKNSVLGDVPRDWKIEPLENILKIIQYGISKPLLKKGKYSIFRMNSIQKGKVIEINMKFIDLQLNEFKKYKLEKGDLLFNRTNSYDLVGKVGLFELDGDYTFAGYLIRLRTTEEMNPVFLNYFLNTKKSQFRVKRFVTPGVSQTNINATNLKSIEIPIPKREEQDQISKIISNIDSRISDWDNQKIHLENLKKGLMQKLLTGKIRVKV